MEWLWSITQAWWVTRCSRALHRLTAATKMSGVAEPGVPEDMRTPLGVAAPLALTGDWHLGQSISKGIFRNTHVAQPKACARRSDVAPTSRIRARAHVQWVVSPLPNIDPSAAFQHARREGFQDAPMTTSRTSPVPRAICGPRSGQHRRICLRSRECGAADSAARPKLRHGR